MTKAEKRIEWKTRFDDWKASGLSVAAWCREQEVNKPQMYYWIRTFEEDKTPDQETDTQWLTIDVKDETTALRSEEPVIIHFGSMSIEVRPGTNMALLSDVVNVLRSQC